MQTRLAESPGRPLERHGNVSPREMTVHGAHAPGQNPAYRPAHSHPAVDDVPSAFRSAVISGPCGYFTAGRASGTGTASDAAPMMPALLRCFAGTIGARSFSSGRNSSECFDTPPPTTMRSGLKRNST